MAEPKLRVTTVWEDVTKISGVNTWIHAIRDRMPDLGINVNVIDVSGDRKHHLAPAPGPGTLIHVPAGPWTSEARRRRKLRKALLLQDPHLVVFHDHRHAEDTLDALPPGFPAVDIAHLNRPDATYLSRLRDLAPDLRGIRAVAPDLADRIAEALGADGPPVAYAPLGVSVSEATSRATRGNALRVCVVGRLARTQKRVQDLPPLAEALGDKAEWTVVGDGPDRGDLEAAIPGARFTGALSPARVREELAEQDVIVFVSEYEGLPLALLEAMALCVVPVVTRAAGEGNGVVRDGETGLVFDTGDVATAAGHLGRLGRTPALLARLSQAARARALDFGFDRTLPAYAAWFREVAGRPLSEWDAAPRRMPRGLRAHLPAGGPA